VISIRRVVDPPPTLSSERVSRAAASVSALASSGTLRSSDFESFWNSPDVREALYEMQNHKCSYCERLRDARRESDIDHFRPKAHYWWLAYEWKNLLFTCRKCNQEHKKDQFPIRDEAVRANGPDCDLDLEESLLLDPCKDDPELFLKWDWWTIFAGNSLALVDHRDERGRTTVATLGLNSGELPPERGRIVLRIDALITKYRAGVYFGNNMLINAAVDDIERELAPDQEFIGLKRAMLRSAGLGSVVSCGGR